MSRPIPSYPGEYRDPNTATRIRPSVYLHGGGAGDAGLQITVTDEMTERVTCVRLPGPEAEEWLLRTLAGLRAAREAATIAPWGET